jgi:GIY-YIG catalytic domain
LIKEKSKRKSERRGLLIKGMLEHVPSRSLELLAPQIKELLYDSSGTYALYNRKQLYYVGLAIDLQGRLRSHLRDPARALPSEENTVATTTSVADNS